MYDINETHTDDVEFALSLMGTTAKISIGIPYGR